jgi:hypothetical protein
MRSGDVKDEKNCFHSFAVVNYDCREILVEAIIYTGSGAIKRLTIIDDCYMTPSEMNLFAQCVNELNYRLITDDEMEDFIQ